MKGRFRSFEPADANDSHIQQRMHAVGKVITLPVAGASNVQALSIRLFSAFIFASVYAVSGASEARAGTTGSLSGSVTTSGGSPIAGARVSAASPSQIASTQTDGLGYDVSPRAHISLTFANVATRCFGGSRTPWSAAYPPRSLTCYCNPKPVYVSNFCNGTSPNDRGANGVALNPYFVQPYVPYSATIPTNAYLQISAKL